MGFCSSFSLLVKVRGERKTEIAFGVIACVLPQGGAMVTTMDVFLICIKQVRFVDEKQSILNRAFFFFFFNKYATHPERIVVFCE